MLSVATFILIGGCRGGGLLARIAVLGGSVSAFAAQTACS